MSQDLARSNSEGLSRSGRISVLGFLADALSEQVLRDGLTDVVAGGLDLRRGTIRTAIGAMAKLPTPEILIVDLSGENQPLQALDELSGIIEPGVRILAIGDTDDVNFYRQITRALGVAEYLFKPITRQAVAQHFASLISRKILGDDAKRGGRVIAVTGARGGVGATSIAVHLAWFLGVSAKRHTVFVETDLHMGSGALLLGGRTGPGLRIALERPDRIDPSTIERLTQPISERLHLLAAEEKLDDTVNYAPGAAARLVQSLRARYNFIILDLPLLPAPFNRELLSLVHHRVIVMDPTLASVRDCLRLLALPNGRWQPQSPTLILNRQGRAGGLTRTQIEEGLKVKIDIFVPDMPKLLGESAQHGEPLLRQHGPLRQIILALAREIGFVGLPDRMVPREVRRSALARLFGKGVGQNG